MVDLEKLEDLKFSIAETAKELAEQKELFVEDYTRLVLLEENDPMEIQKIGSIASLRIEKQHLERHCEYLTSHIWSLEKRLIEKGIQIKKLEDQQD